jgi:hypothetical protein
MSINLKRIKSPLLMTLILLGIILLTCDYNFRWKNEQWKYAVHTDAADYYRYLPMVLIEHQFDDPAENPSVIKYFVGTAVLYLPFFALAYAGSLIFGFPPDGYSMLFPVFISIGTLFYLLSGLFYFAKFLRYYITREWIICVTLCAIVFGTVTYYYTVNSPGWAHIVAFGLICYLLYHFKKITVDFNKKSIIAIIAALSFLFFTRPTDVVIVVIAPFLATDLTSFIAVLKNVFKQKKAMLYGLLLASVPLICQLGIYKAFSGEFIIWSYSKEGFDFLHPEIGNVLFSFAKGLFIYTPLCFLSLFGLFRLYKMNRYLFTGTVLLIMLNIYIISSWWCWNYGYSYGPRAFIEHLPVFFFLLAILLEMSSKLIRIIALTLIVLFSFLNLFQIYQALSGILDQDYKTDAKGYWDVFMRLDKGYSGKFYKIPLDENKENIEKVILFENDIEKRDTAWLNPDVRVTEKAHSGMYSSKVDKNNPYSTGIRKNLKEVAYHKNTVIRASGWFFVPEKGSDSYFAISFVAGGKSLNFNPFGLDRYMQNFGQWEHHTFEMYMPKFHEKTENDPSALVELYYFNGSEVPCYVDDLKIEFIQFKKLERVLDLSWE